MVTPLPASPVNRATGAIPTCISLSSSANTHLRTYEPGRQETTNEPLLRRSSRGQVGGHHSAARRMFEAILWPHLRPPSGFDRAVRSHLPQISRHDGPPHCPDVRVSRPGGQDLPPGLFRPVRPPFPANTTILCVWTAGALLTWRFRALTISRGPRSTRKIPDRGLPRSLPGPLRPLLPKAQRCASAGQMPNVHQGAPNDTLS